MTEYSPRDAGDAVVVARRRAVSREDMEFDALFEDDAPTRARDDDDDATMVGVDADAVVARCARLLCAPRGHEAYRAREALRWAVREIGLETFKDDTRAAHVRERGLGALMTKLRERDAATFGRLERTTRATPRKGDVGDALKTLNHAYLWMPSRARADGADPRACADARVVIEPNLRSHFVVGRATARYARLVECIPTAFVGTHAQLSEIIDFMSTRMVDSFRERGLDIPPWRRPSALKSKWAVASAPAAPVAITPRGAPVAPFDFSGAASRAFEALEIARTTVRAQ
jgi:uncharacterized protein (TIGR01615 family)